MLFIKNKRTVRSLTKGTELIALTMMEDSQTATIAPPP